MKPQNHPGKPGAVHIPPEEWQEVLRPIASLISKSEKVQQKLAPGTWQHRMLQDNLKALRFASALLTGPTIKTGGFAPDDIPEALRALAAMISKTKKIQIKFSPGTSQHTLLQNRLQALRVAVTWVKAARAPRRTPKKTPRT